MNARFPLSSHEILFFIREMPNWTVTYAVVTVQDASVIVRAAEWHSSWLVTRREGEFWVGRSADDDEKSAFHRRREVSQAVFAKVIKAHLPAIEEVIRKRTRMDTVWADPGYQAEFVKKLEIAFDELRRFCRT